MRPQTALRMAMPRSWASADKAVCRQVASQMQAWHWSWQWSTAWRISVLEPLAIVRGGDEASVRSR